VLSNHFARFILVPWSEGLGNARNRPRSSGTALPRHGERSKDWDLRLSPTPAARRRIASEVDSSAVQAVRAAFPAPPERSSYRSNPT